MDIKKELSLYKSIIDKELVAYFNHLINKTKDIDPLLTKLLENIKEFTLRGGKRLRSALAIITYEAYGGNQKRNILKIACAIELMQSFLLIHDDIIDDDDLRRGRPTFHKLYHKGKLSKEYGKNIAILAGDLISSLATEIILSTNFPIVRKHKALDIFNKVIINTTIGQVLDVDSEIKDDFDESDLSKIHTLKTAIYTMLGPMQIGAILAGVKEKELKKIKDVAIPIGISFQIQDDILGMFGNEKKLGKSASSDLKEGKKTLLILRVFKTGTKNDVAYLKKVLGKKSITPVQINKVREIIKRTGSLDHSKHIAEKLIRKGRFFLDETAMNKKGKEFLDSMANYLIKREY